VTTSVKLKNCKEMKLKLFKIFLIQFFQDSGNNEEENVFGDSILDDELRDMEIKIYTQETPQKKSRERNQTSAVVLDRLSGKAIAIGERKTSDVVCSSEKQRNLEASVVENEVTYTLLDVQFVFLQFRYKMLVMQYVVLLLIIIQFIL
jgi:hypothetical protein